jgi:hypothetical protein
MNRTDQRKLPSVCVLMVCALFCSPARSRAEPAVGPDRPHEELTRYAFEDEAVLGDRQQPLGEVLLVRRRPVRESLIRARERFIAELLKSIEDL